MTTSRAKKPSLRLHDGAGRPINSYFHVEMAHGVSSVVLESCGCACGSPDEHNPDYGQGLLLILQRLASAGAILLNAVLNTWEAASCDPRWRAPHLWPLSTQAPAETGRSGGAIRREIQALAGNCATCLGFCFRLAAGSIPAASTWPEVLRNPGPFLFPGEYRRYG